MYTKPVFLTQENEHHRTNDNLFYIQSQKHIDGPEKKLLFDFPLHIYIFIQGFYIPSECFDYLNPLCTGFFPIKFYDSLNACWCTEVQCNSILYKYLQRVITNIENNTIYYPIGYSINYKTGKITVTNTEGQYVQICDILTHNILVHENVTVSFPINTILEYANDDEEEET